MGAINYGKLIIGGIVAGVVFNVGQATIHLFLLADQSAAFTEALGLPEPSGQQIAVFWVIGFLIGIATIWLYAGIRPRFGAGVPTAIKAGLAVFVLAEIVPTMFWVASGAYTMGTALPFNIATLVILLASSVAGAALYTEEEAGAAAPAAAPPAAPAAPEPAPPAPAPAPAPDAPSDPGPGPEGGSAKG